eukprot:gnl/MRDRNA2_/MRDRNA2_31138_c0_seq1.p2 gnl/MRDRNA2_/MRDRNA2_31138_c0~~gnl/MRDRNA2_/MRDRNA2_31138_c0_seq1.p2  ORF type:complete len:209 (+),score=73.75 gnl/MRDRNA2_/MRDRNA2_31138_c0_seq1:61-687(+)
MVSAIVAILAVASVANSAHLRTSQKVSVEYGSLRAIIANTTKALKESQAATAQAKKTNTTTQEKKTNSTKAEASTKETSVSATPAKPKGFPKHADKAAQEKIIAALAKQEEALESNIKAIKASEKEDRANEKNSKSLAASMKESDKKMFEGFDAFNKRANAKAVVGATDVLSKLKHMVHFIKKGALSGDAKAADGLDAVLKDMGSMIH